MDNTLQNLKRRLERWEINHLRQHATDLADRLEHAQEEAETEREYADFWRESAFSLQQELIRDGFTIGLTKGGQVLAKKDSPLELPQLNEGEIYVSTIYDAGKQQGHHTILLPGDNDAGSWEDQKKWAASIGAELPTRVEQALLHAILKGEFKETTYWSCEEHASEPSYAWYQNFGNGTQHTSARTTSFALVPSADCPFNPLVISTGANDGNRTESNSRA